MNKRSGEIIRLNEILGVGYVRDPQARELFPFRVADNAQPVRAGDHVTFGVERDWAHSLTVVAQAHAANA